MAFLEHGKTQKSYMYSLPLLSGILYCGCDDSGADIEHGGMW